jgi:hypothetical protein
MKAFRSAALRRTEVEAPATFKQIEPHTLLGLDHTTGDATSYGSDMQADERIERAACSAEAANIIAVVRLALGQGLMRALNESGHTGVDFGDHDERAS